MARPLVIEVEAVAAVADRHQSFVAAQPAVGIDPDAQVCLTVVTGLQRLTAEAIQQIHEQQLLMLLFVLKTQLHELNQRFVGRLQQLLQSLVHPGAPAQDLVDGGATEQSALWSWMTIANAVVIGIELIGPAGITGCVPLQMGLQQEGFEKPVRVSQMPLRWAGICHPLQAKILGLEGGNQRLTAMSHLEQGVQLQDQVQRTPRTLKRAALRRSVSTIRSPRL